MLVSRNAQPQISWNLQDSSTLAILRSLAAAVFISFLASGDGIAQDRLCGIKQGSAVIVCGVNGGTSSQVFSPGSVIIMRQDALAFPGDLPDATLPDDVAAAREGMTFLERGFSAGENITGFLTGFGGSRDQSVSEFERSYSSDRRGVTVGLKVKRPGYTLFFGVDASNEDQTYEAGSFGAEETAGGNALPLPPASVARKEFNLSLGGAVDLQPGVVWHFSGQFGRIDLDTRRVSYDLYSTDGFRPTQNNVKGIFVGRGSTRGRFIAAQTGLSYGRALGAGFHGGLSGSILYFHEKFDGFTEYLPDGIAAFTFGGDKRTSLISRIGVEVARPFRFKRTLVVPSLRAAWLHEFDDDSRIINVHAPAFLTGSANRETNFTIRTNDPDRDYFSVGASLGTLFANGRGSLAIDYEAIVGHDFIDEHVIGLRLGYRF